MSTLTMHRVLTTTATKNDCAPYLEKKTYYSRVIFPLFSAEG